MAGTGYYVTTMQIKYFVMVCGDHKLILPLAFNIHIRDEKQLTVATEVY
jgi:hypothetical protein